MEPNFQTSFIPKKPIVKERARESHPVSFFSVIAIFIFFAMMLALGGVYFYKTKLVKDIAGMSATLDLAQGRFEREKLEMMQNLDRRLKASSEILSKHIAISPIFKDLSAITMKSIRYTSFSYELGSGINSMVLIKLKGLSLGYRPIALQSDLYTANKHFIDPVFSNLALDSKGNVSFDLEFLVDPSFVDYRQMLKTELEGGMPADFGEMKINPNTGEYSVTDLENPESEIYLEDMEDMEDVEDMEDISIDALN